MVSVLFYTSTTVCYYMVLCLSVCIEQQALADRLVDSLSIKEEKER